MWTLDRHIAPRGLPASTKLQPDRASTTGMFLSMLLDTGLYRLPSLSPLSFLAFGKSNDSRRKPSFYKGPGPREIFLKAEVQRERL